MEISRLVFLYAAEEKSISKGAAKAHMSQQCASRHLQNLEKEFGTPLFLRRPALSLTESGQVLIDSLKQMWILEEKTKSNIEEIAKEKSGQLRLGCNGARAKLFLPDILNQYYALYPKVKLAFHFDDTGALIKKLKNGDLDLVLGVNYHAESQLEITPLFSDKIFFLVTEELYKKILSDQPDKTSLSFKEVSQFSLARNLPESTLTALIERKAAMLNVELKTLYTLSDYSLQIELCGRGNCGAFCPESLLPLVEIYNSQHAVQLHIYPIADLPDTIHIDLIRNASTVIPQYEKAFIQLLKKGLAKV